MQGDGINEIYSALDRVIKMPGQIIECGAARCGTTILIAEYLKKNNTNRKIFACDTFSGFNKDELAEEQKQGLTTAGSDAFTHNSFEYVKRKIRKFGFAGVITPVKGYFEDTLENICDNKFSFVLIDCDLQKSMSFAAERIFPSLTSGGIMLFDDYTNDTYKGAKIAVEQFISKHENEISNHGLLKRLYFVKKT